MDSGRPGPVNTADEMVQVDPRWQRFGPSTIAAGPGWSKSRMRSSRAS